MKARNQLNVAAAELAVDFISVKNEEGIRVRKSEEEVLRTWGHDLRRSHPRNRPESEGKHCDEDNHADNG